MLLYPCFVLFLLSIFALIVLKNRRLSASSNPVSIENANRNVINLHETPLHFFVVIIFAYMTSPQDQLLVALAWGYVVSRIVHTLIQLFNNQPKYRSKVYILSLILILSLWIRVFSLNTN